MAIHIGNRPEYMGILFGIWTAGYVAVPVGEGLAVLDRDIAQDAIYDRAIQRLLTITGVDLTVAARLMAAIGSTHRFNFPRKLVRCFGLNLRVLQSGLRRLA